MKKLKKFVFGILLGVILAVVALIYFADSLVKAGIEEGGTYAMGVGTQVSDVKIGLFSGEFAIDGLNIDNPKGFEGHRFIELGHLGCDLSMGSLVSDKITVDQIALKGVKVSLMKGADGFNYAQILDHLAKVTGGSGEGKDEPKDEKPKQGEGKKFVVKETVIEDVVVHVELDVLGKAINEDVKLSELRIPQIGTDSSPAELGEVIGAIVEGLVRGVVENGEGRIPAELLLDLKGKLKNMDQVKAQLKEMGQEKLDQIKKDTQKKLNEAAEDLKKDAGKAVGDLLKGLGE